MLAEEMKQIYDEDPEEKKRERERERAKLLAKEDAESAADPSRPKSKAQRDRERAEAKAAAKAKEEAAAAEKKAAAAEAKAKAEAEAKAEADARVAEADSRLKRQSVLAQASIDAKALPLATAMAQLLAPASPRKACAGLLVLSQATLPLQLIAPLLAAILSPDTPLADADADADDGAPTPNGAAAGGEGEGGDAAARVVAWRVPLAWLINQSDDRAEAQRELLRAVAAQCAQAPALLQQAAPLLRALWRASLVGTPEVVAWAEAPLPGGAAAAATQRARRYAAPFVEWLQTAPVEDLPSGQ